MKKVLFAISNLQGGGAEKVLVTLLNHMDPSKYKLTLLLIFNEGVHLKEVPEYVEIKYLFNIKNSLVVRAIYKMFRYLSPRVIYKWFIKEKYDVEIAFLEGITTKLISGSPNPDSKKIAWVHTDLNSNHLTRHYFKSTEDELTHYKRFDDIICVSKDAKAGFEQLFHEEGLVKVIYNPIDTNKIMEKAEEIPVVFEEMTICTVGRLTEVKGVDRLIRVHAKLVSMGIKNQLVVIGTGLMEQELKALCQELQVTDSVQFMGFLENPYPYIKACDIFVSPSKMEGFSLVVAEALILGKPVLATRTSGPVEILNDGEYGELVENSEPGLFLGLKKLIENEEIRKHYSKKAEERKTFFDLATILREIDGVIDQP